MRLQDFDETRAALGNEAAYEELCKSIRSKEVEEIKTQRRLLSYDKATVWSYTGLIILSCVLGGLVFLLFVGGAVRIDTADRKATAARVSMEAEKQRAETYRVRLLENYIDPETGKPVRSAK